MLVAARGVISMTFAENLCECPIIIRLKFVRLTK